MDLKLLDNWTNCTILIVGDVMLDRFVYGQVERVSPEAPVPVLHQQSEKLMLGGAANVARNIIALGGKAILVSILGQDADGDLVAKELTAKEGIDGQFIRLPKHPTTVKTRFVCGGHQIMRLDVEHKLNTNTALSAELLAICRNNIGNCDAVVLSDYAKGVLSSDVVQAVIKMCISANIPVLVDPKNRDVRHYADASVIKPNAQEAAVIFGHPCQTDAAASAAVIAIAQQTSIDGIVLTRGAQGMTIWDAKTMSEPVHIPTVASEVYDVSGAGDTAMASMALATASGASLVDAAKIANSAAGLVVGRQGTAVVRQTELIVALRKQYSLGQSKIATVNEAAKIADSWRYFGFRVGLTNGCFDLLHPGHISLLKQARDCCDRLIVALNTDASVRRLKGSTRPVQNETARATVMAAIESVDLVILFDEDTPLEVVQMIKPDRLIKGGDYTMETVVGADFVQRNGGEVVLIDLVAGKSTTSLIERMKEKI